MGEARSLELSVRPNRQQSTTDATPLFIRLNNSLSHLSYNLASRSYIISVALLCTLSKPQHPFCIVVTRTRYGIPSVASLIEYRTALSFPLILMLTLCRCSQNLTTVDLTEMFSLGTLTLV